MDRYEGLGRAGIMNFQVRVLQLNRTTGRPLVPITSSATATFTWEIDAIAPVAVIGTHAQGTAPPPCSNPATTSRNYTVFEISSNEPAGGALECRLSNWVPRYSHPRVHPCDSLLWNTILHANGFYIVSSKR